LPISSGTTGQPKGVMLTHGNIISNCEGCARALPVRSDDTLLSFLPLSHSLERMAGYYMASLFSGATLYFAESVGRLIQNVAEVKPTLMTGVPRIYEKIHARFTAVRHKANAVKRALLDRALEVGLQVARLRQEGKTPGALLALQYKVAYEQVFGPLTARLGGRVRFFVSGGAPLARDIAEFFLAAGILILEGYGLTEAAPVVSVNRPDDFRFGTVGRPLDNVRVRVATDGELLVKGPNVMLGYWGHDDETRTAIDAEGWLHTGDIGRLERDGFLRITDRKKDLFKNSGGKYIAPQHIERLLCASPLIEQACLVGDNRPYCVALLVPTQEALDRWSEEAGTTETAAQRVRSPEAHTQIQREIDRVNARIERHEAVRAFHLIAEPFTEAEGLLTPSLKLRRREVMARHADEIEALFAAGRGRRGGV
ncbi:MAG: long-chain fatty acid--CoA ligase, partial [Myxococcales bacterium]|nr:long-chain fatty acid--CoA ligase [Myxococcales bacterium]